LYVVLYRDSDLRHGEQLRCARQNEERERARADAAAGKADDTATQIVEAKRKLQMLILVLINSLINKVNRYVSFRKIPVWSVKTHR